MCQEVSFSRHCAHSSKITCDMVKTTGMKPRTPCNLHIKPLIRSSGLDSHELLSMLCVNLHREFNRGLKTIPV